MKKKKTPQVLVLVKPGSHMIVPIVSVASVASKSLLAQTLQTTEATETIGAII